MERYMGQVRAPAITFVHACNSKSWRRLPANQQAGRLCLWPLTLTLLAFTAAYALVVQLYDHSYAC